MFKYGDGYRLQIVQKNPHTAKENTVNIEFSAQGIDSGFFQMLFVLFLNFFFGDCIYCYFMHMSILPECMSTSHVHGRVPQRPEEGIRPSGMS